MSLSFCIYRNIQYLGYQNDYGNDVEFQVAVKKSIALAFVPAVDVIYAFENLVRSEYFVENEIYLDEIVQYFERTWIGALKRAGGHQNPVFEINWWNVYEHVLDDLPRTNNAVEGWHYAFNSRIQSAHAIISKLIKVIQQEQNAAEITIAQYLSGREISPAKRRKYRDYDKRMKNEVRRYERSEILQYLSNVATNIVI